jgi:hypothetical protein
MLTWFFYRRALRIMAGDLGVRPWRLARDLDRLDQMSSVPAGKMGPPSPNPIDIELLTQYLQERRSRPALCPAPTGEVVRHPGD